jgi:hypothetical protein
MGGPRKKLPTSVRVGRQGSLAHETLSSKRSRGVSIEEAILEKVRQLSPEAQERLLEYVESLQTRPPLPKIRKVPYLDREREMKWLRENRSKYPDQWVAVEGDRLILADPDAMKVYKAAKAEGIESPFVSHIVPDDDLPFGGW